MICKNNRGYRTVENDNYDDETLTLTKTIVNMWMSIP
mgnify:CR=1 FL=1